MTDFSKSADIVTLEEDGRVIELRQLDGEPWLEDDGKTPVTARICGVYSARFSAAKTNAFDRALKNAKKRSAADMEATQLKLDAVLVLDWAITIDGKKADALTVFTRRPDIREQIVEEANDHAAFLALSSRKP